MKEKNVLLVEDDLDLCEAISDTLTLAGYACLRAHSVDEASSVMQRHVIDMVVTDVNMPGGSGHDLLKQIKRYQSDIPVLLMTAFGTIQSAVQAIKEGAADYMTKPFEPQELLERVAHFIHQKEESDAHPIAADPVSQQLLGVARKVASGDTTVMITGESGTGKEVLARYIHQTSKRKDHPFIAINCAAIPENMLESMLFGYEKGAFTGAYQACPGKFEQANGGTLLLDEVSEMDINLQAKLLRVLQEREVERLGGKKTFSVDVRVIATSNRRMHTYVEEGKFREDLFYRLNVFPLNWRPLRDRKLDIIPLTEKLLVLYAQRMNKALPELSQEAKHKLVAYQWPGNVRELENVVQRALVLQVGGSIEAEDLHFELEWQAGPAVNDQVHYSEAEVTKIASAASSTAANDPPSVESLGEGVRMHEYELILQALDEQKGCRKDAAEMLGISPRTLRYKLAKMREMGMDVPEKSTQQA